MMDALHRILSGGPSRRGELIAAGLFVFVWFAIDVVQFGDWAIQKWNAPKAYQWQLCTPVPGYYCGSHDCSLPLTQNN